MAQSWTQADLTAINNAIALGARTVAFADGKRVTYHSIDDMFAVRDRIARVVCGPKGPRRVVAAHNKGIRPSVSTLGFEDC